MPAGLLSIQYPSGRTVSYTYDTGGRLLTVGGAKTYTSSLSYASHGGLQSMQYGNNRYEQTCYNNRLQAAGIRVGSSTTANCANSSDLLNLAFGFSSGANNGNVQSQTIYAGGPTFTQTIPIPTA